MSNLQSRVIPTTDFDQQAAVFPKLNFESVQTLPIKNERYLVARFLVLIKCFTHITIRQADTIIKTATLQIYVLRHAHLIRFTTGPENSDLNIFPRLFPSLGKYGQIGRTQTRSYHE